MQNISYNRQFLGPKGSYEVSFDKRKNVLHVRATYVDLFGLKE